MLKIIYDYFKEIKEEMINEGNLNLNEPGVYTVTITYVSRDKKTYSDAATITVKEAETEVNLTFEQIFAAAKTQANLTFTAKDGKIKGVWGPWRPQERKTTATRVSPR